MKKYLYILPFICLFFLSNSVLASHVVGGDVEYECVGSRQWKIRLTIYRDCSGAQLCSSGNCPQPMVAKPSTTLNPAGCTATPNTVNFTLSFIKVEDIGKTSVTVCGNSAKNGCNNLNTVTPGSLTPSIEKYVFEGVLNLNIPSLNSSNCSYWDVYWELCCRNSGIVNLQGSSGQSFRIGCTINIFNRSSSPCLNNSPKLLNEPITVVYSGRETKINLGAVDPDGDSLTYQIDASSQQGGGTVVYQPPFSAIYPFPLDSTATPHKNYPQPNGPYVIIDSTNGDISFSAINSTANYIKGNLNIKIKQWSYNANSTPILVGITQRDLQLYVVNVSANNIPQLLTYPTNGQGVNLQPIYNYQVNAGQQICFNVIAKDTDVYPSIPRYDSTFLSWNGGIIRPGKLTFGPNYSGLKPREDQWQFCWQTDSADARSLPYYFTVTASDNFCPRLGSVTKAFSVKVNAITQNNNLNYIINKQHLNCGLVNFKILKTVPFINLDSCSLKIALNINDKNFIGGYRSIIPLNINPQGNAQDSTPRLMFTDTFRYTQSGKYYALFTYKTSQGISTQIIDSIIISADSIAQASIFTQFNTNFCNGDSSLVMSYYTSPKYKYQWQSNGVNISNSKTERLYVKLSGSYRLLVTDTLINCNNYSNVLNFNVYPRVSLKPSISQNQFCAFKPNGIIYYDSSTISSGTYTRTWHFGDGSNSTNLTGNKTYTGSGTFPVKLVVNSNFGCKDSVINNVSITQPADLAISANGSTTFCKGNSIVLTGGTFPNANYYWYKNNQLIIGNFATQNVTEEGSYKLIVDQGINCKDTSNIITTQLYPSPKAGFTINNASQCENNNRFMLTDTTSIASGTFNRIWSWDNNTSSLANLNLSFNSAGVKSIKLKATSNNGCSDSITRNVTVLSKPNIGNIAGNINGLSTLQTYDYNLNQQLNHTYNWSLTNGNIISGQATNAVKVQWLSPGTGKIIAVILNNVGCSDSTSINVNISGGSQIPSISSFTPQSGTNGTAVTIIGNNFINVTSVQFGGVNAKNFTTVTPTVISALVDTGATGNVTVVTPNGTALLSGFTYTTNTGLTEFISQAYTIFPNPVNSEIIIESNKSLNETLFELVDLNGKVVLDKVCNESKVRLTIDVKNISQGIYLLRIKSKGQINTVKIVKQ